MKLPTNLHKVSFGLFLCLLLQLMCCLELMASDSPELRRLRAGMDLFPSFLAADTQIRQKKAEDGKLHIALIYNDNPRRAEQQAEHLRQIGKIKNIPLKVQVMRPQDLRKNNELLAGIFITQPHLPQLPKVVHHGKTHSVITFSPFNGDVAQGISGGISVTARILPKVNIPTVKASGLRIKPFFLRIASLYE